VRNSLTLLNQLSDELEPILRLEAPLARQGRRLLSAMRKVLGAEGGALFAWEPGGELVLSATRGLKPEVARRLREVVQYPPTCPGEPLGRLGWVTVSMGKGVSCGWNKLDLLVSQISRERALVIWPLAWVGGSGMLILTFTQRPRFAAGFPQSASGLINLWLSTIMLKQRAASHGEDYQRIFENSRDMIYLSSRDGRWENVNQAGVEMLGYESPEELLAVPDSAQAAYFNAGDRMAFMAAIEKDGFVKDYEVQFKKKDGSPIHVSITAQVRTREGKVLGYEGIIKDITSRKTADEADKRERELISSILELVPVALFVIDKDHRVRHWNHACEELTGFKREEVLGTDRVWEVFQRPKGVSLADVVLEEDLVKLSEYYGNERLRRSPLGTSAWEAEAHFDDLGGKPKDLFFTAALLRNSKGEVEGAVEAIMDSTQTKDLERSLAESEQLYRTMVESNQEGITLYAGDKFVFANGAFMEMFGLKNLDDPCGDFLELVAPASQHRYLEWMRNLNARSGVLPVFEGQGIRKDGAFDLEMNAAPATHKGNPATLFTVRDVTFRKRMEEQLISSERLAATGKLAFDIAHEVNNPLGGILTYAHLLYEDLSEGSELYPTVEKIIKLTNRCKIIVRGLLDFARQDAPEMQQLNLNQVLEEMLSLVDGHVILRGVEIKMDLTPDMPNIYGHRSKLEQVFLNMVLNAAEAMDGKGAMEISTQYLVENKEVRVVFQDNGPGMEEDVASRIFEPFFTTKSRGRGTGLGLSISHGIISQHGGRIDLITQPGQGARITVALPTDRKANGHAEELIY
jgi:PAS domain S-box-containing protein